MVLGDIIIALILGILFAAIFGGVNRSRSSRGSLIAIFIVFFLFAWAGGLWLRPVGPPVFGMYWVPGLIMVVLIFLLLGAAVRGPTRTKSDAEEKMAAESAAAVVLGAAFWFLITILILAIIVGYLS